MSDSQKTAVKKYGFIVMDDKRTLYGRINPWWESLPTLLAKILCCAEVSYGGDHGFEQKINMCKGILADTKYIQQKYLIGKYFDECMDGTGNCVFGVVKTLKALESGAAKTLMVCEKLDIRKYIVENSVTGEIYIGNFDEAEEENDEDDDDICFLTDNKESEYNSVVEFVTLKSPEGSQFSFTFKGIDGFPPPPASLSKRMMTKGECRVIFSVNRMVIWGGIVSLTIAEDFGC
ncbi:hypothetical protein MKW92_031990 [Papaver armeniacum]|nr:hypothetical protein MKW92_031990 [Papaver armeniacum]